MQKSIWVTEFTTESVATFFQQFSELHDSEVPVITVYIDSYGGELHSLNAMRDIIKSSQKPVCTIAVGKAMSCGALLLASGTKGYRFAAPNSSIMIHYAHWLQMGNNEDQQYTLEVMKKLTENVYDNFAKDTGMSKAKMKQKLKEISDRDWYLTATEAQAEGLVDLIGFPNLMISKFATAELVMGKEEEVIQPPTKKRAKNDTKTSKARNRRSK